MGAAIGISFPFIQNESVSLISDVCTEGERSRAVNALNCLGLLVYQASQGWFWFKVQILETAEVAAEP